MTTSLPITTTSTTRTTSCDSPESELRDTLIRSDSPRSAEMPTGHFRSLRNSLGQGIPHPLYALPLSCELCPRRCGVDRAAGERGVCGAAGEVLVARAALHFWEEPPISGEDGSGTIFFSGCPLRCVYCQNASIALGEAARAITVERLAAIMGELEAAGALNINCVTPTHFAPQIRAAVALAREQGMALPVLWNTGGYETVEAVRGNVGFVDAYLTDFKYADGGAGGSLLPCCRLPRGGPRGASDHGRGRRAPRAMTSSAARSASSPAWWCAISCCPGPWITPRPWCGFCTSASGAMSGSRS